MTFELTAPENDPDWRYEKTPGERVRGMAPAMTRKTAELYYRVPIGENMMLKPGFSRFKQPRNAAGDGVGRTMMGVAASLRF